MSGDQMRLEGCTEVVQVMKVDAVIQNKGVEFRPLPLEGRYLVVLSRNHTYSLRAEHPHVPYSSVPITLNLRKTLAFLCSREYAHLHVN